MHKSKIHKKIAAFLIMMFVISIISGCGDEEEAYSSPSFSNGDKKETSEEAGRKSAAS